MHLALYRSERPERFEEIIGQKHIVKILRNQLAKGTVSQAYLFTGTRGTGKTTTARILAKAVNCIGTTDPAGLPCCECENCKAIRAGSFLDVIELDAASNNGVEDLRSIIDSVQYPPAVGRYKVYIIDEVHMLSAAAENAFLKTLEEPPEYAIFILATTDPEKVRQTIRSRCMTLNFRRVSEDELTLGMEKICKKKHVAIADDALRLIASRADGSVRDALSILEQCISGGDESVTRDMVLDYIGSAGRDYYIALTDSVMAGNAGQVLFDIDRTIREGKDARQLIADWLMHYRDLMIVKYVSDAERVIGSSDENTARLRAQSERLDNKALERAIKLLSEYVNLARYSTQPRLLLETAAVELAAGTAQPSGEHSAARQAPDIKRPAVAQRTDASDSTQETGGTQETIGIPRAEYAAPLDPEPLSDRLIETAASFDGSAELDEMWRRIVDEVAKIDGSFPVIVGKNGRITAFENGEIVLTVKKTKLRLAENKKDDIERAAKEFFGRETFVTIKAGNVAAAAAEAAVGSAREAEDTIEERDDRSIEDVAEDIGRMMGIDVKIT